MHSGQGSTAGGSTPTSVQLWKSMQSSKAGSQDHQLHSSFLPQNLWHPSASWVTLKSREYSLDEKMVELKQKFLCKAIYNYKYNITTKPRTIFTYLALTKHIALPRLRDVHLPVLYLRNLYWERKFQGFWKLTLLKSGSRSHQNLPHCHKRD